MAMVGADLAEAIRSAMGFPLPASTQLLAFGNSIVAELQINALVNNASGISGVCPPVPGPLSSGAATGGIITGLLGSRLASAVASAAGYGSVSSKLSGECTQLCQHIMTGLVSFASGNITGTCTDTLISPGTLTLGAGANGIIAGLSGSTLASLIHSANSYPGSVSGPLTAKCTAICNYIMANASATYASGTVTGTAPAGGGSLAGAAGAGGRLG